MHLIYSTVGYDYNYLRCIDIFLKTFVMFNDVSNFHFLLICDEQMITTARDIIKKYNIKSDILKMNNSNKPYIASMHKIHIFDYPEIMNYTNIIYVDLDCIFTRSLNDIVNQTLDDNKIYAYKEQDNVEKHRHLFWSLNNYTNEDIEFFKKNNMYPFNCGCFLFKANDNMKKHFNNIINLVSEHKGEFFYEQSFMNYYFNKNLLSDYSIINDSNYFMNFKDIVPSNNPIIIHFCGNPGDGFSKITRMTKFRNLMNIV